MTDLEIFKTVVEQTTDGVFITDKQGIIEYVNPAFEQLTGFSENEALGKTPNIIKSGLHKASYYKKLWSAITSGKSFRGVFINKKKNGELFYTDHSITPIRNEKGEIFKYVGMWKDVGERVIKDQRKDEFISTTGHELKTPLTVLKLLVDILTNKIKKDKSIEALTYANKMDQQINKITSLLNDLLDISKIRSGRFEMQYEYFSISDLIEETADNIQSITASHKIIFKNDLEKMIVLADKTRISQVVTNLLNNAIKYSRDKDKIEITLKMKSKVAVVTVQDWGVGIEKEYHKKIFERYFSINGSTGLGMGLYICSQIIKKHRGKIWVKSGKGKGSCFYFSLPLAKKTKAI